MATVNPEGNLIAFLRISLSWAGWACAFSPGIRPAGPAAMVSCLRVALKGAWRGHLRAGCVRSHTSTRYRNGAVDFMRLTWALPSAGERPGWWSQRRPWAEAASRGLAAAPGFCVSPMAAPLWRAPRDFLLNLLEGAVDHLRLLDGPSRCPPPFSCLRLILSFPRHSCEIVALGALLGFLGPLLASWLPMTG